MRIRFNENYLNVTTGSKTEVMEVGSNVRRAQSYFSQENSIENLRKNFTITVQEDSRDFEMKLVPRTDNFRRRLNYLVVRLNKQDFLLAIAGSGRQKRRQQCIRHRRHFAKPENFGRNV